MHTTINTLSALILQRFYGGLTCKECIKGMQHHVQTCLVPKRETCGEVRDKRHAHLCITAVNSVTNVHSWRPAYREWQLGGLRYCSPALCCAAVRFSDTVFLADS